MFKGLTPVLMFVFAMTASAEIKKVHIQVGGCLRATCSRKVAKALSRGHVGVASVDQLTVEDSHHGIGFFVPRSDQPLDLREMYRQISHAGYELKAVVLETDGRLESKGAKVTLVGIARPNCVSGVPAEMLNQPGHGKLYAWIPGPADLKEKGGSLEVCAVQ